VREAFHHWRKNSNRCVKKHGRAPRARQVGVHSVPNSRSAPVPAHVIDKGIPTAGLLAQVLVAKYIAQWVGCVGVALMPLVQAMQAYETGNCQNV